MFLPWQSREPQPRQLRREIGDEQRPLHLNSLDVGLGQSTVGVEKAFTMISTPDVIRGGNKWDVDV